MLKNEHDSQGYKSERKMFTPEEDTRLVALVSQHGTKQWKLISKMMHSRSTRQCRERYRNYLDPNINRNPWSNEEDQIILDKYEEVGPRWSYIATFLCNRTDVSVKNRHASLISRKTAMMFHGKETKIKDEKTKIAPKEKICQSTQSEKTLNDTPMIECQIINWMPEIYQSEDIFYNDDYTRPTYETLSGFIW